MLENRSFLPPHHQSTVQAEQFILPNEWDDGFGWSSFPWCAEVIKQKEAKER
jgi:hypothetical protein